MADGITRIAVEGFKSISKRQSIEIAPLTILAGANSSGKSSIMQPLLMLKQTLESTFDPGPLMDWWAQREVHVKRSIPFKEWQPRHKSIDRDCVAERRI